MTHVESDFCQAKWSPDGTELALTGKEQSASEYGVFLVNTDGTDLRELTDWSPPPVYEGRQAAGL